jgi:hypothetical protein
MNFRALPRRRPVPTLASAAFVLSLLLTLAYFAGVVPGVAKTFPTFVDLVMGTVALLALAALAWAISLAVMGPDS